MSQATAVLGLLAETSIHAGAGQMLGAVDLPIQRESHTEWPCVFGSGVKGALRAQAEQRSCPDIDVVFGPDPATQQASEHGGAVSVGDARLLLMPVRSLTGPFRWVTCPAVLERFQRDCKRLGVGNLSFKPPTPKGSEAWVTDDSGGPSIFLEEFRLCLDKQPMTDLIRALAKVLPMADAQTKLEKWLCVVDDTLFGDLARFATPVTAHIGIDNSTKTVVRGNLRYEESLPPETVLYVPLIAARSRKKERELTADSVLDVLLQGVFGDRPYLQLGGNETVGMGWCQVKSLKGGTA